MYIEKKKKEKTKKNKQKNKTKNGPRKQKRLVERRHLFGEQNKTKNTTCYSLHDFPIPTA